MIGTANLIAECRAMKVVMAAADDSESGNAPLVQAADLARSRGAQLVVLTVI
jgi:hypothetical protein